MTVPYTLRRSTRARGLRISVYPDGAVVVTAPEAVSRISVERFVKKEEEWARRAIARAAHKRVIHLSRGDIPALKRRALAYAQEQCAKFAARYGFRFGKVSVRAQKSRWGSCSRAGNLSFNYKLAALPEEVARYIIVHEICHLGSFDHSKRFWELVEREVPDHKRLRAELRSTAFLFR